MTDERSESQDVAAKERELREHEREAQEHEPSEGSPEEKRAADPGGTPAIPVQKGPGS